MKKELLYHTAALGSLAAASLLVLPAAIASPAGGRFPGSNSTDSSTGSYGKTARQDSVQPRNENRSGGREESGRTYRQENRIDFSRSDSGRSNFGSRSDFGKGYRPESRQDFGKGYRQENTAPIYTPAPVRPSPQAQAESNSIMHSPSGFVMHSGSEWQGRHSGSEARREPHWNRNGVQISQVGYPQNGAPYIDPSGGIQPNLNSNGIIPNINGGAPTISITPGSVQPGPRISLPSPAAPTISITHGDGYQHRPNYYNNNWNNSGYSYYSNYNYNNCYGYRPGYRTGWPYPYIPPVVYVPQEPQVVYVPQQPQVVYVPQQPQVVYMPQQEPQVVYVPQQPQVVYVPQSTPPPTAPPAVEVPADGASDNGGAYSPYDRGAIGGGVLPDTAQKAIVDIQEAWILADASLLQRHVDAAHRVQIYREGKYDYTASTDDYLSMTRKALGAIVTQSFVLDQRTQLQDGRIKACGKHIFYDPDNHRQTDYVCYWLQKVDGRWLITAIDTAVSTAQAAADPSLDTR